MKEFLKEIADVWRPHPGQRRFLLARRSDHRRLPFAPTGGPDWTIPNATQSGTFVNHLSQNLVMDAEKRTLQTQDHHEKAEPESHHSLVRQASKRDGELAMGLVPGLDQGGERRHEEHSSPFRRFLQAFARRANCRSDRSSTNVGNTMRTRLLVALATGVLLGSATSAPAQVFGFGYGRGYGYRHGYSGFGFAYRDYGYARPYATYRNPFVGDVAYAERASNDFRHEYEKRKGDPLGIKADVKELDETLESLRKEAESFGGVTDRGRDLMRGALDAEDRIDRRFRRADDRQARQWSDLRREIDRLARAYRVD